MTTEGYFFSFFSYVWTPHLNRLSTRWCRGTVQMRGHNMFYPELANIIPNYHQILSLIQTSGKDSTSQSPLKRAAKVNMES